MLLNRSISVYVILLHDIKLKCICIKMLLCLNLLRLMGLMRHIMLLLLIQLQFIITIMKFFLFNTPFKFCNSTWLFYNYTKCAPKTNYWGYLCCKRFIIRYSCILQRCLTCYFVSIFIALTILNMYVCMYVY